MRPPSPVPARRSAPLAAAAGAVALAVALAGSGCSRGSAPAADPRATAADGASARPQPAPFDWKDPTRSLEMDAGEVAARLGSFAWSGETTWSSLRGTRRSGAVEQHRIRQLVDGPFAAESDLDPGAGPGSETGMRVVFADGMTWARSRYAASGAWRERPSDHGHEARRFRDQAFGGARDVAGLLGPALQAAPTGEASLLGRPARRFALRIDRSRFVPGPTRGGAGVAAPKDPASDDTALRLAFLDGREPLDATGELVADAATGAPLEVRLKALFGVKGDPDARVEVELSGRITALGGKVAAVRPPTPSLPDERKPKGVARALERAGLRKKGGEAARGDAGEDDGDE